MEKMTREQKIARNHRTLAAKKKIVLAGNSRVFNNWQKATHGKLTVETFFAGLEWLAEDPLDEKGRTTRELGLEGDGSVVHLNRFFEGPVELATYRYAEDYDRSWRRKDYIWQGSSFTWEASPDEKAFWGKDICSQLSQIAINVEDYI